MTWLSASFTQHCPLSASHGKLLIDRIFYLQELDDLML